MVSQWGTILVLPVLGSPSLSLRLTLRFFLRVVQLRLYLRAILFTFLFLFLLKFVWGRLVVSEYVARVGSARSE